MSRFPITFNIREEKLHFFLVVSAVFAVYIWCAPRTIVLEDDSFFVLAAYYNGIAHPPGYPLYTLLAHLATYLPFGSIAFRVHLLSAFLGAMSCGFLWWFSRLIIPGKLLAFTTALLYGVSNIFWSQSIIAEVYTLNVLLFLILLILAVNYLSNQNKSVLICIAFVYGLALSNHWPLIILSSPMLICIVWPVRKYIYSHILVIIPAILLGLLPYLWMFIRSQMDPLISFNGPINNLHELILTVSRDVYSESESSPSANWFDKLLFSGFVLRETMQQFGSISAVFAVTGFIYQWKYWPRLFCFALLAGYLGNTFLLIGLLDFDYDYLHRAIFRVYPLIAYLCVVLWISLGVYAGSIMLKKFKHITLQLNHIQALFCLLLVGVTFAVNLPKNYRAKDNWAEKYASVILESLADNAIIFTKGDTMTGQVGYLHFIDGVRPDVSVYNELGLAFSNRLFRAQSIHKSSAEVLIGKFIEQTDRPIYYVSSDFQNKYGQIDFGLYRSVDKKLSVEEILSAVDFSISRYIFNVIRHGLPVDPWEAIHYRLITGDFCRVIASLHELNEQKEQISDWLDNNCNHYHGLLEYVHVLLEMNSQDYKRIMQLLDTAMTMKDQSITKADTSTPEYYRGELLLRQGNIENALQYFQRSYNLWPHPQNPAFSRLKSLAGENENPS